MNYWREICYVLNISYIRSFRNLHHFTIILMLQTKLSWNYNVVYMQIKSLNIAKNGSHKNNLKHKVHFFCKISKMRRNQIYGINSCRHCRKKHLTRVFYCSNINSTWWTCLWIHRIIKKNLGSRLDLSTYSMVYPKMQDRKKWYFVLIQF